MIVAHSSKPASPLLAAGISILEVLASVAIIALITAAALPTYHRVVDSTEQAKLENDVGVINRAIGLYLSSGGNLDGVEGPQEILDRLKSASNNKLIAFDEGLLDRRLRARMQSFEAAAKEGPRAYFDHVAKRFRITRSVEVGRGIERFILDESYARIELANDDRPGMMPNSSDGWIWNYTEAEGTSRPGPTRIELHPVSAEPVSEEPVAIVSVSEPEPILFDAPEFSAVQIQSLTNTKYTQIDLASASTTNSTDLSVQQVNLDSVPVYLVTLSKNSPDEESRIRYWMRVTIGEHSYTTEPEYFSEPFTVAGHRIEIHAQVIPLLGSDAEPSEEFVWHLPFPSGQPAPESQITAHELVPQT